MKQHLVILTGAGASADSGLETFRDSDGLWAKHRIEDVCTPEALDRNPALVLDFYNQRRRQLKSVEPNAGHHAVAELEMLFDVDVITQNVDNLHERAGSTKVLHLHGELTKCRSMKDPSYICEVDGDVALGDFCPKGGQLRPHIVFFGEAVPMMDRAIEIISTASAVVIAGTSLAVYPAASLFRYAPTGCKIFVVNPAGGEVAGQNVTFIKERFAVAMPPLAKELEKMLKK
ncbi:MAG: NAD-dependent deacylase [Prevotellaceae bacterium]|jgi:NAD-dependent deacetylase|nr:NAD-dependent deacylase [Prevotellaceae bacterium]